MMKKHKKHNSILCWQDAHIKFELVLTKMVEIGTFMFTYSLDLLGLDIWYPGLYWYCFLTKYSNEDT